MPDHDWIADRSLALTVQCPYCRAEIGRLCIVGARLGGATLLANFPAHLPRVKAARQAGEVRD